MTYSNGESTVVQPFAKRVQLPGKHKQFNHTTEKAAMLRLHIGERKRVRTHEFHAWNGTIDMCDGGKYEKYTVSTRVQASNHQIGLRQSPIGLHGIEQL